jgi:serine/threonine protein kinase
LRSWNTCISFLLLIEELFFLAGIDFIHSKRIIHLDLKPQNIVLANKPVTNNSKNGNSTDLTQPEDKLKIIDFGLARALGPPGRVSTVVELQQFLYFYEQHILSHKHLVSFAVLARQLSQPQYSAVAVVDYHTPQR